MRIGPISRNVERPSTALSAKTLVGRQQLSTYGCCRKGNAMRQTAIFGPVFATVFLTLLVWVYMYIRRISFLSKNTINPTDMAVPGALARISPPEVANPSDNLKNLFEIPVIFYVMALYLYVTSQVDAAYVTAAWIFVAFRAFHSAVHCTINIVLVRFYLYLISTLAVWFIAGRAALHYFGT